MLDLYKNIKKFRRANKMTQEQLAVKTGYTDRSSIAKIERGDVDLPQSKILLFANALNVSPGDLMGNTGISDQVFLALDPDKESLLSDFDKLNAEGRQEVLKYVRNLTKIADYREDWSSSGRRNTQYA